jgi:hypothetical protein
MRLEAPLSDDFDRLPRFAASAAPAAICCFFDFAGIQVFIRDRLVRMPFSIAPPRHSFAISSRSASFV